MTQERPDIVSFHSMHVPERNFDLKSAKTYIHCAYTRHCIDVTSQRDTYNSASGSFDCDDRKSTIAEDV
jgi:hypothetical protein